MRQFALRYRQTYLLAPVVPDYIYQARQVQNCLAHLCFSETSEQVYTIAITLNYADIDI